MIMPPIKGSVQRQAKKSADLEELCASVTGCDSQASGTVIKTEQATERATFGMSVVAGELAIDEMSGGAMATDSVTASMIASMIGGLIAVVSVNSSSSSSSGSDSSCDCGVSVAGQSGGVDCGEGDSYCGPSVGWHSPKLLCHSDPLFHWLPLRRIPQSARVL